MLRTKGDVFYATRHGNSYCALNLKEMANRRSGTVSRNLIRIISKYSSAFRKLSRTFGKAL
jgi:hypothetical protein